VFLIGLENPNERAGRRIFFPPGFFDARNQEKSEQDRT
jgi:hypothetical protein